MLGSLIIGVPAKTFGNISGTQLLAATKDPSFVGNILTASEVVQQAVVVQVLPFLEKTQRIKIDLIFQEKLLKV